jgi:ADP-heptose:LPS heptosyltransferase
MSIEGNVRALWLRLVAATLPRPGAGALSAVRRVLVLRHDRLGDMLSTLGVISALARHGYTVDVLASPENAGLLEGNPWGVRVVLAPTGGPYDAVVDTLVLKPAVNTRTVRLIRQSRAPVRIGAGSRRHDFVYTHRVVVADAGANHLVHLAELLVPFGIAREEGLTPVPLPLTDDERRRGEDWWTERGTGGGARLFVNVSAGGEERRWPEQRYTGVLQHLVEEEGDLRIALSSAPSDRAVAVRIAAAVGGTVVAESLRDAFAVLGASDVVLTPDTSVAHAAAGFQRPSVVMIADRQLQFAPWRAPGRLVVTANPRLDAIQEGEVLDAVRGLLRELPHPRAGR